MAAGGHQRHRRQERQQARGEGRFRRVHEDGTGVFLGLAAVSLAPEAVHGINRRRQKQQAGDAQE
jgi:hypothetical protein